MDRIKLIRKKLQHLKLDALIVNSLVNIRYLTNFAGSNATLIIRPRALSFITDGRYAEQVSTELFPLPGLKTFIQRDVVSCINKHKLLRNCRTLGVEADHMSLAQYNRLRKALAPLKLKSSSGLVESVTESKKPDEVASIRQAAKIADDVYSYMLGFVKPGMRESDVAAEISYQAKKRGSEADAFDIIVASGPRSALPHGRASAKKIRKGELVTFDFGCCVNGFNSDMTRTFVMGKANREQRKIYNTVLDAHLAAIDAIRIGMPCKDLDSVARNIISEAGYGEAFNHSLGHGLGINVHEKPILSQRAGNSVLVENSVITIEPGIYIPGKFGVRIEDDIYVSHDGNHILNTSPKELLSV